jgi:hypothetical protein
MTMTGVTSAEAHVEVDGAPLDPLLKPMLTAVEIDTTLFKPSQFRLAFRGRSLEVLEAGGFQLGALVSIQVTTGEAPVPLFRGEITAVDVEYGPGEGHLTVVRGLDMSHRLMRGTKTEMYQDQTASAVVLEIIGDAEILPGKITETTTVYPFLSQANVSSWVFIQQLAALEDRVAYVDAEGLFNFCTMPLPEEGPPPVMSYMMPFEGAQMVLGKNLLRLRATVTGAEQVPEVTVLGWNPDTGTEVIGPFPTMPSTFQSLDPAALPTPVAGEMGASPFFATSRPFEQEGAAINRAKAIGADLASVLAELEGQCLGNPAVKAGQPISIGMCGPPFDGQYVVTTARHVFEPANGGYTTWFTVGGRQDRSLFALSSGRGSVEVGHPTIIGLVPAVVSVNEDPEKLGRVQVVFPWLGETYQSAWARTVQTGASMAYGGMWLPEVGDEVLVGFDRGDIDHPFVIGNLYSALHRPDPSPQVDGLVASRWLMSRMHHKIQFDDGPSALGITIQTGSEICQIQLDDDEQAITVRAGQVTVEALETVTVKAATDISVQAGGALTLQAGGDVSVQAGGAAEVTAGGDASIEAGGAASITAGADASIEAAASVAIAAPEIALG